MATKAWKLASSRRLVQAEETLGGVAEVEQRRHHHRRILFAALAAVIDMEVGGGDLLDGIEADLDDVLALDYSLYSSTMGVQTRVTMACPAVFRIINR